MRMSAVLFFITLFPFLSFSNAGETDASIIFSKCMEKYKAMDAYSALGVVSLKTDADEGNMRNEVSFSILMKKPNRYLIIWVAYLSHDSASHLLQGYAIWNNGSQSYFYMSALKAYSKMENDAVNLSAGGGISHFVCYGIPALFLDMPSLKVLYFPENPELLNSEEISGENCYVIRGDLENIGKISYWISQRDFLILKRVTVSNPDLPSKGITFTELHTQIKSPQLSDEDFMFKIPSGTTLKDKLFDLNAEVENN